MSEIGAGTGSSYPGTLDTNSTVEVNSPAGGKTKARAEVPNDLADAIVKIETELGTDPAGTTTNVKTFLQTEHDADGTHAVITATSIKLGGTDTVNAMSATPAANTVPVSGSDSRLAWGYKPAFRGAFVTRAADKTLGSGANLIDFDQESYDTDSIHDNVTNNMRLTVPAGVTKIRIVATILLNTVTNLDYVEIKKDGSGVYYGSPLGWQRELTYNLISPVLPVSSGNYFECNIQTTGTGITMTAARTAFAMEIIE